ncbi:hypothetical protein Ct61P_15510 [Colletotrichum tofieldiae]|nr:hypothetical protein Ct61P_15510 [Colletotrichum tofieldiae]
MPARTRALGFKAAPVVAHTSELGVRWRAHALSGMFALPLSVPPLQETINILKLAHRSTNIEWEAILQEELDELSGLLARLRYLEDVVNATAAAKVQ